MQQRYKQLGKLLKKHLSFLLCQWSHLSGKKGKKRQSVTHSTFTVLFFLSFFLGSFENEREMTSFCVTVDVIVCFEWNLVKRVVVANFREK